MLTEKTPETFKDSSVVNCAGQKQQLMVTYYNRTTESLTEFLQSSAMTDVPDSHKTNPVPWMNAQVCLFLIKSFDDGTDEAFPLNPDGLLKMESYYPGVLTGLIQRFHQARLATIEKN